ncbi:MAG: Na+/H+ antiporter [Solirubrobacterales bacterium]
MSDLEVVIGLIAVAVVLVRLADLVAIPYPIVLVIAGILIGLAPGAPAGELPPEAIFLVFLPPLLFSAGQSTSPAELREELGALGGLVIGLSIATMVAVAAVAHAVIPWMNWTEALLLGAIVAPTDPVAAIATFTRVGVPRRVARLVEGESMVNDATALVLYRVFTIAVVSGSLTFQVAIKELVIAVIGGVAIGLAIGWAAVRLQRRLADPALWILLSVAVAYAAYLVADHIGASGVLSAVTAGLFVGTASRVSMDAETRLSGLAFWGTFILALNVLLFILLGLRLPSIFESVQKVMTLEQMLGYGAIVSLVVIGVRLAWQFGPVAIGRYFSPALRFDTGDGWKERLVVGWSGMRGAVSLAAALSLPLTLDSGAQFEGREVLIFLTVAVIVSTLILQGLTLPLLIRRIGLRDDEDEWSPNEAKVRVAVTEIALGRLGELEKERPEIPEKMIDRYRRFYDVRRDRWKLALDRETHPGNDESNLNYLPEIRRELIKAERQELIRQRRQGEIDLKVFQQIQRELDLDETRLPPEND